MKMHKLFNSCQKGIAYFSATAGAMSLIFAVIGVCTGGISLLITVPISIGVGLLCGCYGAQTNLVESRETEQTKEYEKQLKEQERLARKAEMEDMHCIKNDLDVISNEIKSHEGHIATSNKETKEDVLTTNEIISAIQKMPELRVSANDDDYLEYTTEVKVTRRQHHLPISDHLAAASPLARTTVSSCSANATSAAEVPAKILMR